TLIETVSGMQREVSDDSGAAALECLKRISWKRAWLLYVGVKEREITDEENAALLVRKLRGNIPDRLMLEPKAVALALKLYNASFPGQLKDAWEDLENHPQAPKEARAAERRMAEQYQERVAKETEARTLASAAAKRQREGMERLKRLEEDAKARAALKSATAAQGDPRGNARGRRERTGAGGAAGATGGLRGFKIEGAIRRCNCTFGAAKSLIPLECANKSCDQKVCTSK